MGDSTPSAFTLNDNGNTSGDSAANTEDCTNVPAGSYTVTEGAEPPNFTLESLVCTATGNASGGQNSMNPAQADITVAPGETVTCTYTNKQNLGAILVTKTRKHAADGPDNHPQPDVSFTVNGVTKQTDSNGQACFDGLAFGEYTVHETVPTGYDVDANDKSVTVDNSATCSDVPYVGETVSFHNTPLTNVVAKATSQVTGGTKSTITCTTGDPARFPGTPIGNSPVGPADPAEVDANGLEPGTYTCQVVIDP
jgi:hypothetical protein